MKELLRTIIALAISKLPKGILIDHRFFELYQSKGWHASPVRFNQPIPNTAELPDALWDRPSQMVGVNINIEAQSQLLRNISEKYLKEYHQIPEEPSGSATEYTRSSGFSGIDGAILYSLRVPSCEGWKVKQQG